VYSFAALWPDGSLNDAGTTRLSDPEQADRYARLFIRELKERLNYRDPELKMVVRDGDGDVVRVIPF
jgi:hypothetical protein